MNELTIEKQAEGIVNTKQILGEFVEWLKHSDYMQAKVLKSNYGISKILTSVSYEDLDKALQEYLKGE